MQWDEAWLLFQALMLDPSSHVAAAVSDMGYPATREFLALADIFDLSVAVNTKQEDRHKSKPYPRPFEVDTGQSKKSEVPQVSQDRIWEELRKRRPGGQ